MATKDYSSIYSIKDFFSNQIAPKYFTVDNINQLNVGLFGYVTDAISTISEDTFNGITTLLKEFFPQLAKMPETLYNYTTLFNNADLFANPSTIQMALFVNESCITSFGTKTNNEFNFVIDSDMIINVEDKQFMVDYDIIIKAKPYKNDYIFSSQYDVNFNNSKSSITNPYIKLARVTVSNTKYLMLMVSTRQLFKTVFNEIIINNDKINAPVFNLSFSDQLSHFEVFYKSPKMSSAVQMTKKMLNTAPSKTPFCYYRLKNENELEISFTTKDNYFQPLFNSELTINLYTTLGSDGNFDQYEGTNISVVNKSDTYEYNNKLTLFASAQSKSSGGSDVLDLENLRKSVIDSFSTVGSYSTETDLQTYFSNFNEKGSNEILFVKKRDDALERIFSSFLLMKDSNNDIYHTNTLHIETMPEQYDDFLTQSKTYILKPGRLFKYKENSLDIVEPINDIKLFDDLTALSSDFLYTNPFLITVCKSPSIVGYYLNSINKDFLVDYNYVNSSSWVQFIMNKLSVRRNAFMGEDYYSITATISPTTSTVFSSIIDSDDNETGKLKLKAMIEDSTGYSFCYFDFNLKSFDRTLNTLTYEAVIQTNDNMTSTKKFQILNTKSTSTNEVELKLINMTDAVININTFYHYDDIIGSHEFGSITDIANYVKTNTYSTSTNKIDFITPLCMMRSQMKYQQLTESTYNMKINFCPLVRATSVKSVDIFKTFINNFKLQYDYMNECLNLITNNFGIDIKFYNTYGYSKNFTVGEQGNLLDKLNCGIKFKVAPVVGTDLSDLSRDLKLFIKSFAENINSQGSNYIYISNLISSIESEFSSIRYVKFIGINKYDASVQIIENNTKDFKTMSKDERINYVPEYITMSIDDVNIEFITT